MPKKQKSITASEQAFLAKMERHPELRERMERILNLAESPENQGRTADEIEGMLIEEVRRLGAETMKDWAQGVERAIGLEMESQKPSVYSGKKNG